MGEYERKVRKILKEHGYSFDRQAKGDHEMWYNPKLNWSVSVDGVINSRHTANGILKQAKIKRKV